MKRECLPLTPFLRILRAASGPSLQMTGARSNPTKTLRSVLPAYPFLKARRFNHKTRSRQFVCPLISIWCADEESMTTGKHLNSGCYASSPKHPNLSSSASSDRAAQIR